MTTLTGPIDLALGSEYAGDEQVGFRVLQCTGIEAVARNVKSFHLRPADGRFEYDAGQYVTVHAVVDGREVSRCFTLSSTPSRPGLTLTVKRKAGGPVSTWLHDRFRVGDRIRVTGPLGRFTLAGCPANGPIAFVAAGSGITPVMSMARRLIDAGRCRDIAFVYSAGAPTT